METVPAKTIVTRTKSPGWFGADYNMNIYRGCCHGCIYCDSRSECYGIEDFDRVRVKRDALRIIRDDLRRKVKRGVVATGSMSDPYNPFEREMGVTRHALELLDAYQFGVAIATKSDLITRDTDILSEIKTHSPVLCKLTITCLEDSLARKVEPHAPPSSARFTALEALAKAGLFCGILLMPTLPFVLDTPENVLGIVARASACGVRFIYPAFGMTLRGAQRDWYFRELDKINPSLHDKYLRCFGSRYQCTSPHAKELWSAFSAACDQQGILYNMQDIIRTYKMGYTQQQLQLF